MRKRVVSIITPPVRFLRRLLGLLVRLLRTAFAKLVGLRGRQRIAVVAAVAVVIVVLVLSLRPGSNSDTEVRQTLDRYAQATRDKDYQTLCDDLYASELIDRIRSAGLPCEVALRTGLQDRRNPQLKVLGVEVSGDQALARTRTTAIGEPPSLDTVRMVRQGGHWRVASLSVPGAQLSPDGSP
jgi:type II secretory pathway component PulM